MVYFRNGYMPHNYLSEQVCAHSSSLIIIISLLPNESLWRFGEVAVSFLVVDIPDKAVSRLKGFSMTKGPVTRDHSENREKNGE